jgi:hypothetical protein
MAKNDPKRKRLQNFATQWIFLEEQVTGVNKFKLSFSKKNNFISFLNEFSKV